MAATTDTDRYILEQVRAHLDAQETVESWAYLEEPIEHGKVKAFTSAAKAKAYFAVLTNQRLLFIETRVGAFHPLLENHGVESYRRAEVIGVHVGKSFVISLDDELEFQHNPSTKYVSTQREFFERMKANFDALEDRLAHEQKTLRKDRLVTALGLAIAGAWLVYKLLK